MLSSDTQKVLQGFHVFYQENHKKLHYCPPLWGSSEQKRVPDDINIESKSMLVSTWGIFVNQRVAWDDLRKVWSKDFTGQTSLCFPFCDSTQVWEVGKQVLPKIIYHTVSTFSPPLRSHESTVLMFYPCSDLPLMHMRGSRAGSRIQDKRWWMESFRH